MADAPPTERRLRTPLPAKQDPDQPRRPRFFGGRFRLVVLALLAGHYLSVALFAPGKERAVPIPYSPTFLAQVDSGNVTKVSATGETLSGVFKKPITYPPSDKKAKPATNFDTEVPTFAANTDALATRLKDPKAEIPA